MIFIHLSCYNHNEAMMKMEQKSSFFLGSNSLYFFLILSRFRLVEGKKAINLSIH